MQRSSNASCEIADCVLRYEWSQRKMPMSMVSMISAPHLILADYKLPALDGMSALNVAKGKCPDIPFIFLSGTIGEDPAIESLKQGATDYVLKSRLSEACTRSNQGIEGG